MIYEMYLTAFGFITKNALHSSLILTITAIVYSLYAYFCITKFKKEPYYAVNAKDFYQLFYCPLLIPGIAPIYVLIATALGSLDGATERCEDIGETIFVFSAIAGLLGIFTAILVMAILSEITMPKKDKNLFFLSYAPIALITMNIYPATIISTVSHLTCRQG